MATGSLPCLSVKIERPEMPTVVDTMSDIDTMAMICYKDAHGEKGARPGRLYFSGLRIVDSRITSSKLTQFLNQSPVFSEKICP
jgi:hypothetical protein